MKEFQIDDARYEIIWATDILARNGIGCELRSVNLAPHGMSLEKKLLAKIFRNDEKKGNSIFRFCQGRSTYCYRAIAFDF
jgi:hypothetical protein